MKEHLYHEREDESVPRPLNVTGRRLLCSFHMSAMGIERYLPLFVDPRHTPAHTRSLYSYQRATRFENISQCRVRLTTG